jgi:hypothetical protein
MFTFVPFLRERFPCSRVMSLGRDKSSRPSSSAQQADQSGVWERHRRCLSRRSCYRHIHPSRDGAHHRVYVKGRFMRNAPNLNSADNTAIRAEIGERLRDLLSKEQPRPPPRVQHLLDCLSTSDATPDRSRNRRHYFSWSKRGKVTREKQ